MEPIVFVTEPLLTEEFVQFKFVAPLASWLTQNFEVTVASPAISEPVARRFEEMGIRGISGDAWLPKPRHARDEIPSYATSWTRDALFRLNGRRMERLLSGVPGLRINLSMTTAVPADVWYVQGRPIGPMLRTIQPSLRPSLRLPISVLGPAAGLVDERHIRTMADSAGRIYANSRYIQSFFLDAGIHVQGTLPQYLFPSDFGPTTRTPRRDYALVYLGKETELSTVRSLIRSGVPVKIFGGKSGDWIGSSSLDGHPNLELAGHVSHEELKDLYTNALFTAFPFTEEPFGLVPIESMACGTPVLTYGKQGPGETVLDGETGWLVDSADEFQTTARRIFARAYPSSWTTAAIERAREFRLDRVAARWGGLVREALDQRSPSDAAGLLEGIGPGQRPATAH